MTLNIYAVYDRMAESYAAPFVLDPKVANRTFNWMKKETDAKDREDKEIRLVGFWDNESGSIASWNDAEKKVFELSDTAKEADNG